MPSLFLSAAGAALMLTGAAVTSAAQQASDAVNTPTPTPETNTVERATSTQNTPSSTMRTNPELRRVGSMQASSQNAAQPATTNAGNQNASTTQNDSAENMNRRSAQQNSDRQNRDTRPNQRRGMQGDAMNQAEYDMLDRDGDGSVTEYEFAMTMGKYDNVTSQEARFLFQLLAGDDDLLSRQEFLNETPEYRDAFADAVMDR